MIDPALRLFQDGDIVSHNAGPIGPTGVVQRLALEADIDPEQLYYFVKFADRELGDQVLAENTLKLVRRVSAAPLQ